MAYISQRGQYWRAEVRRRGIKPVYRTFDTQKQAQQWARKVESEIDAGLFIDKTQSERTTLREALERYGKEIVPTKRHPTQEQQRINRWLKHDLAYRALSSLRGSDFAEYRDARRASGRAENTIRLELQLVGHLFEMARKEWGMENLQNPLKNIRKPSGSNARERRLANREYELILNHLSKSPNQYAAAAFQLAIETTLRKNTLFTLQWNWVDLESRIVTIPKEHRGAENKGVPAALPLSRNAVVVLRQLKLAQEKEALFDYQSNILDTSQNAVLCVWKRTLQKLEISDLRWHDLRHEGISRLFEKGLHPLEVATISGHKSMQMLKRYTHLKSESLLEKLG